MDSMVLRRLHGSFTARTWWFHSRVRYFRCVLERSNIMKRALGLLLVVGLLIAAMATAAVAASPADGVRDLVATGSQVGNAYATGFVDADDNGISDNFVDANNDGICDNFVDADGDGINDLRGTVGMGGQGNGTCSGDNFVDADGDGVCDNVGSDGGSHQRHQGMGGRDPGQGHRSTF